MSLPNSFKTSKTHWQRIGGEEYIAAGCTSKRWTSVSILIINKSSRVDTRQDYKLQ